MAPRRQRRAALAVAAVIAVAAPIAVPPASAQPGSTQPTAQPAVAQPASAQPTTAQPAATDCATRWYAELAVLAGATGRGGAALVRSSIGYRGRECEPDEPEGFNVRLGLYVDAGSRTIGAGESIGAEGELNLPTVAGRLGVRVGAAIGTQGTEVLSGGLRLRFARLVLGVDAVTSTPGSVTKQTSGVLASIGIDSRPGGFVLAIEAVLVVGVLASFSAR